MSHEPTPPLNSALSATTGSAAVDPSRAKRLRKKSSGMNRSAGFSREPVQITAECRLQQSLQVEIGTESSSADRDVYGRGVVTRAIVRDPWPYPGVRDGRRVLSAQ
jgi:hypothetical protein